MFGSNQVKGDQANVTKSLGWSLKPVSITMLFGKDSDLFVKIKAIVDLCISEMQVYFSIKSFKLNELQNFSNFS